MSKMSELDLDRQDIEDVTPTVPATYPASHYSIHLGHYPAMYTYTVQDSGVGVLHVSIGSSRLTLYLYNAAELVEIISTLNALWTEMKG